MAVVDLLQTYARRIRELECDWARSCRFAGRMSISPHGVVHLPGAKTGARTVRLGATAVATLGALSHRDGYVANRGIAAHPVPNYLVENVWRKLRVTARLENARIHDLRHTVGTYAAFTGANAFAIRDLLGHKTMAMTNRYVSSAAELVRGTADAVSARIGGVLSGTAAQLVETVKAVEKAA